MRRDFVVRGRQQSDGPGGPNAELIATAVAEKMAALMTSEYLAERARRGSRRKFDRVLRKVRKRNAPAAE